MNTCGQLLVLFVLFCGLIVLLYRLSLQTRANPSLQTILTRKSVRKYLDKPLARKQLDLILQAAMAAPSAGDQRPATCVVVTEKTQLEQLAKALPYGKMLTDAAAAIVVCGQPEKSAPTLEQSFWVQDCSAASQNILLAAEALGLGGVWIGVYPNSERIGTVRKILDVPADAVPLNVISLGYPAKKEIAKNKFDQNNVHWERW